MEVFAHIIAYIVWNPDAALLDLGVYELRWYSLLFAAGFVASYYMLRSYFRREGAGEKKLDALAAYAIVATIIGARLGHCLFYDWEYYSDHLAEIFLPVQFEPEFRFVGYQGLASHGGAIGIFIALIIFSRKHKVNFWWTLDKLALVAPLAGFFIRMGNLMNSEIIGKPAEVPWAFIFVQVDNAPRHPGQLYEAIAYLLIFIFLNIMYGRLRKAPGYLFGLFLVLLFSARFIIEFFKINQSAFEAGMALNMGQLLSVPFIISGVILMILKNDRSSTPEGSADL